MTDPSSILESATGIVAIVMIFGLPIVAILTTLAIVLVVTRHRHRERMKMIEQGIMPPPPTRTRSGNFYALLITGAILFAFGLGMFLVGVLTDEGELEPGLVFGTVGLALLVCFFFIRANRRRKERLVATQTPGSLDR